MSQNKILKFLENFSFIVFALVYWKFDLIMATKAMMVWFAIFVVTARIIGESLNKLQVFTCVVVFVLGGATVLLQDEAIIKWKTTAINSVLAIVFTIVILGRQTITERLLGDLLKAPANKLRMVNFFLILYFIAIAFKFVCSL